MSPQPDQDTDRSVLSWESVLDANDTDTNSETSAAPVSPAPAPAPAPDAPPAPMGTGDPEPAAVAASAPSATGDIELTIAPLSLDPLSLNPLPPIGDATGDRVSDAPDVLGDLHLELPPLELPPLESNHEPAPPVPSAAPAVTTEPAAPVADMLGLTIAPLDLPDLTPSGQVRALADDVASPNGTVAEPPAPLDVVPAPADGMPPAPDMPPAPAPTPTAPTPSAAAPAAPAPDLAPAGTADAVDTSRPPAAVAGLPDDPVPHDASPTTVIAEPIPTPEPAPAPASPVHAPAPSVPSFQPNQAITPQAAHAPAPAAEPAPMSRKDRKHQEKLKKQQQKAALQKAKAATSRSGAGGVALFFTLLVLVGLIAGAIIFGRPYLFPDEWDDAARPYGEAVETARGADFDEPLTVQRRAADVFATSMTAQLLGPWEAELPTWRSLGLVTGAVDASVLRSLVPDWTTAYYSSTTSEVIANDAAGLELLDAAITEAMAAAALDQETGWSSSIDDSLLDSPALTRAIVTASSRTAAAATAFGAADNSVRDIAVSTFLPPVLEYRLNAPLGYAEFSTDDPTQRSADFEALRVASQLQLSSEPELVAGDALLSTQQPADRTFWYLAFASYVDASTAYGASNDLVQASLAFADSGGRQCTYATFSGTDVEGTARLSGTLQQWVANVPTEMNAEFTTLATGTMQLRTCDPGAAFDSRARFGVSREIARFRAVELAAVAAIPAADEATADRAAAIAAVRDTQIGLPMTGLGFEVGHTQMAEEARSIVAAASGAPVDQAE